MSLNHYNISSIYQITQDCINDTINVLHNGDYSIFIAATQAFGVFAKTVHQKLQRKASKNLQLLSNKALDLEQKQVIRDYIKRLNEWNILAQVSIICVAANYISAKSHSDPLTPLSWIIKMWIKQFLDDNPQFYLKKKQKPLVVKHKNAYNRDDFQKYFKKYKNIYTNKGIADENIWNMNETRFCAGCGKVHWVITLDPNKPMLLTDPDN